MTRTQKLQLEQSENRQAIGRALDIETEKRADTFAADLETLTKRATALETELQTAILASADDEVEVETRESPEARELADLIERGNVGAIFAATMEHRPTDGADRELQQHYGIPENCVPLALLETRAVSPAPADVGQNLADIEPYVFPQAVASFLGIPQPTVARGEAVYPTLTSKLVAGTPAENASQSETTGSFSADVLSPGRLQASFFYSREDRARFAGMGEALRRNLSDGLADGLDRQILVGTNGLLTGTVLANHNVTATVTTYALYRDHLAYGRVDGRYAGTVGDIRLVVGAGTYGHAAKQFRSDNAGDRAAIEDLQNVTAGVRVSAHVPAVDASHKQNAIIRLGMRRDMVAPIWEGIEIIDDPYTKSASGQVQVTAIMLFAIKVLRSDGFYKQQTQHA